MDLGTHKLIKLGDSIPILDFPLAVLKQMSASLLACLGPAPSLRVRRITLEVSDSQSDSAKSKRLSRSRSIQQSVTEFNQVDLYRNEQDINMLAYGTNHEISLYACTAFDWRVTVAKKRPGNVRACWILSGLTRPAGR